MNKKYLFRVLYYNTKEEIYQNMNVVATSIEGAKKVFKKYADHKGIEYKIIFANAKREIDYISEEDF